MLIEAIIDMAAINSIKAYYCILTRLVEIFKVMVHRVELVILRGMWCEPNYSNLRNKVLKYVLVQKVHIKRVKLN
ncbi:hypothetical protein BWD121_015320 [Bartonella sp. WD12.1]|nr:hypothetical protein BWD121_015320 [Bartonella sp. WD12.1]